MMRRILKAQHGCKEVGRNRKWLRFHRTQGRKPYRLYQGLVNIPVIPSKDFLWYVPLRMEKGKDIGVGSYDGR